MRMVKLNLSLILSAVFLLTGCKSPPLENEQLGITPNLSVQPSVNIQPTNNILPDFTFQASIAEHMPTFTFDIYEGEWSNENEDFPLIAYNIKISCPELSSYTAQSIEVFSGHEWIMEYRELSVDLVDVNFDGYADIQVLTSRGNANINYSYYRWVVFSSDGPGEFEEFPFFSTRGIGVKPFPDTNQIIVTIKANGYSYAREMYQYDDDGYSLMRREEVKAIEPDTRVYILSIEEYRNEEYTEIYSAVLTEDEYYGDYTIRDNYLRFGVG